MSYLQMLFKHESTVEDGVFYLVTNIIPGTGVENGTVEGDVLDSNQNKTGEFSIAQQEFEIEYYK